ncbi:hypothetical protein O6H91_11G005300 [Diphasiastrum complanatum]|uniref:Uncharacterized protein n=1 Tax=Diphasiastrum complanatum TaxID=34168 RepID=A0ACC2C709_DIPCM|nr:hypothetical protein O6H91_11G005300 [Diphasiastrum complanatum]
MWSGKSLMSMAPGDFLHFKAHVPLHHVSVGSAEWRYYDFGPKVIPPLVCLSGTAGTAEGYRVIAADAPPVWSHQEWISSFEKFLDTLGVHHVHLYGTSLGGFLGQLFAQYRPRRVKSLMLSNTFLDTRCFAAAMSWSSLITWTPEFMLKRYILSGIRDGPQEPLIADSIDFVVNQLETLSREELASRLTLNTSTAIVGQISLPDSAITIMDTNDYCAIPQALKDQVAMRYPGARRASLKSGGDFPFLSRADEVTLHAQLHLRRAGVEGLSDEKEALGDGNGDASGSEDEHRENSHSPYQHESQKEIRDNLSPSRSKQPLYRSANRFKSSKHWSWDHPLLLAKLIEEHGKFILLFKDKSYPPASYQDSCHLLVLLVLSLYESQAELSLHFCMYIFVLLSRTTINFRTPFLFHIA